MLKTSSLTDSSTSAAQIVVEYDEVDGDGGVGGGKSVTKSKNCQKSKKPQRLEKVAKAIGLKERLSKHWSSVN